MSYDRRTIRRIHVVVREHVGRVLRRQGVQLAVPFCIALAHVLVSAPAAAEFTTLDSAVLEDIEFNTDGTRSLLESMRNEAIASDAQRHVTLSNIEYSTEQTRALIASHLPSLRNDIQDFNDDYQFATEADFQEQILQTADLETIKQALTASGGFEVQVMNFDEVTIHIDELEDIANSIMDMVGPNGKTTLLGRIDSIRIDVHTIQELLVAELASTASGGPVADPGAIAGVMPVVAPPVFVPLGIKPLPTFYPLIEPPDEFEPPEDIEAPTLDWAPPTKTGKQDWTFNVPTSNLSSIFGAGIQDLTFTTDLAWYGGGLRTSVHGAILAMVGLGAAFYLWEELRRTA